jgi:cephalosporin hydroxylase
MSDETIHFQNERERRLREYSEDSGLMDISARWLEASMGKRYVYNFDWLGRPIIQYPQDMVAIQELVWRIRPDLIVETGIAHGGSLILSASMLALLDYCDALTEGSLLDPAKPRRKVLGIDIDIRRHNRAAIESHPMANRIEMIEGSSIASEVIDQVHDRARRAKNVMLCLDSNHTHAHVLAELLAYSDIVTTGSYCVVFDTFVEDMPIGFFEDRPWDPGNSPKTAVREFLKTHSEFEIDKEMNSKLLITVAPDGYLRRTG